MSGKKVLIIEDDVNILYALEAQFLEAGFEVEVDEAEEEGIAIINRLRKINPDYIILDLILPRAEGFDLLRIIKGDERLRDKAVFVFTDVSEEDSRSRSLALGADYFFFKEQFDTTEFCERALKVINNRR